MAQKISKFKLYLFLFGMLMTGSMTTIFVKLQGFAKFNKDGEKHKFNHAFVQAFIMFLGEFFCLLIYGVYRLFQRYKYGRVDKIPDLAEATRRGYRTQVNILIFIIPAFFDIFATSILFFGLMLIPASGYQMIRGSMVFVVAIISMIFLNKRYHRHQWTSLAFL